MPQADLEAIRGALLQRRGALVNMTADGRALGAARPQVAAFLDALPAEGAADADWAGALPRRNEAICVPTQARQLLYLAVETCQLQKKWSCCDLLMFLADME